MSEFSLDQYQTELVQGVLCNRQDADVRDLLNALSYNPRRLVELRYGLADGHRYTVEETANVFSKPVGWVMTIESYALAQLYQCLVNAGRLYPC